MPDEESNQENGGDDGARSVHEDGSEDSESLQDDDDIAFIEEQRHVETGKAAFTDHTYLHWRNTLII